MNSIKRPASPPVGSKPGLGLLLCLPIVMTACSGPVVADEYAVFKSTDRARSWVRADSGLPSNARVNAIGQVEGIFLAATDAGVFQSTDLAARWRPTPLIKGSSVRVLDFATLGSQVFAATEGGTGVFVSANQGNTWSPTACLPNGKVRCLTVSRDALYAGLDVGGVRRSLDAGGSWQSLTNGLPARAQVFALASVEGHVFAGLYSQGLYTLAPGATTWTRASTVTPLVLATGTDTLIAGQNPGGLHWSPDRGITWDRDPASPSARLPVKPAYPSVEPAPDAPVWALASKHGLSLAGAAEGIYLSQDGGRNWSRSETGLPAQAPGIAFLVNDQIVLAAIPLSPTGSRGNPK